jgi:diacylglycerol kinase (ATP)
MESGPLSEAGIDSCSFGGGCLRRATAYGSPNGADAPQAPLQLCGIPTVKNIRPMRDQARIERLREGTAAVGILLNPLSGRIRKCKEMIRHKLTEIPNASCREVTTALEIRESIDVFLRTEIDLLVVVGGDGTMQAVLTHLFSICPEGEMPLLAVIPGGTTNMTALDLGSNDRPEKMVQKLSQCLLSQRRATIIERHALCIEQKGMDKVYGMFFGVGLIARAVIFSQGRIKNLGVTGEIYSAIITLGYFLGLVVGRCRGPWAPVELSVGKKNGDKHAGTYAFLLASTLDRLLFGMRPYWGREPAPLHVTFVRQQRKRPWRSVWPLISGGGELLAEEDGYHSCNTGIVELLMDDDYIVDGEAYRAARAHGPLRITAVGPVEFLAFGGRTRGL